MSDHADVVGALSDDSSTELFVEALFSSPEENTTMITTTRESSKFFDSKELDLEEVTDEEQAYRRRVYSTTEYIHEPQRRRKNQLQKVGSLRRLTQRFSNELIRRRSSMMESLPDTPAGWTVLLSLLLSTGLGYEVTLQKSLTQPPCTFGQFPQGGALSSIYGKLTADPNCILSRPIQPSLFVGTRGVVASTAAYLLRGPSSSMEHLRFREIVTSSIDGATFGVDWEVPWNKTGKSRTTLLTADERQKEIREGPIREPVIIIMHGINNDASFGYMTSLQRSFANRGWNAAAMNFRGCGGVPMTTPRGYNASYTGDIRSLVWTISGRMAENVPVFLVGNSLGASVMTKYLGEEGMSGTLPKCVSGAAGLGNPLSINSSLVRFPFNVLMALGVKKTFLKNWAAFSKMKDTMFRTAIRKALLSPTIGKLDHSAAPILARNDPVHPFAFRIGFQDGDAYWLDSSSYRLIRFISVPYLHLTAEDDFLVAAPNKNKLAFCVSNPNIMVAETRCGGHLGWQESPPNSDSAFGATSWADAAAADFFDAVIKTNMERHGSALSKHTREDGGGEMVTPDTKAAQEALKEAASSFIGSKLKSRL